MASRPCGNPPKSCPVLGLPATCPSPSLSARTLEPSPRTQLDTRDCPEPILSPGPPRGPHCSQSKLLAHAAADPPLQTDFTCVGGRLEGGGCRGCPFSCPRCVPTAGPAELTRIFPSAAGVASPALCPQGSASTRLGHLRGRAGQRGGGPLCGGTHGSFSLLRVKHFQKPRFKNAACVVCCFISSFYYFVFRPGVLTSAWTNRSRPWRPRSRVTSCAGPLPCPLPESPRFLLCAQSISFRATRTESRDMTTRCGWVPGWAPPSRRTVHGLCEDLQAGPLPVRALGFRKACQVQVHRRVS